MRRKIIIGAIVLIFIFCIVFLFLKHNKKIVVETEIEEMTPEEEISDKQLRNTILTLYFVDNTGAIFPEARNIDVKEVIDNPYETIIKLLINGPVSENLESIIPEDTELINTCLENDNLIINFNNGFLEIEEKDPEFQKVALQCIEKSLKELVEVNKISILINGESNVTLKNSNINLSDLSNL